MKKKRILMISILSIIIGIGFALAFRKLEIGSWEIFNILITSIIMGIGIEFISYKRISILKYNMKYIHVGANKLINIFKIIVILISVAMIAVILLKGIKPDNLIMTLCTLSTCIIMANNKDIYIGENDIWMQYGIIRIEDILSYDKKEVNKDRKPNKIYEITMEHKDGRKYIVRFNDSGNEDMNRLIEAI